ncbi:MAG: DUF480 domain-containing protein [Planctomycetes bacterium]|nr:DUF480 domain-containing protein [Planctomycetota bacterium]
MTTPAITLGSVSRRILGVLLEKEFTTPNQYPLSVNSLTLGANQKSNRHPIMSLDEYEVADRLKALGKEGWVANRHEVGGRVEKWDHKVAERLGLARAELAVLTELLLRGAQQPGELRSRASRMHAFPNLEELEKALRTLVEKGYARLLPRRPGERAARYDHAFYQEGEAPAAEEAPPAAEPPRAEPERPAPNTPGLEARLARVEEELALIKARLESLEGRLP